MGRLHSGNTHDYTMLKKEFTPTLDWFSTCSVRMDLGYLGFNKDYVCESYYLPVKSSKTKPLRDEDKQVNRLMARQRIGVEHVIGGTKRYRVLSNRVRSRNFSDYDRKVEVCAGLWNLYVTHS